jgi:hypothetical protein
VCCFQTHRYPGEDPAVVEQNKKTRSLNITIVYPPTLVGEYSLRLSEWSPLLNLTYPIHNLVQKRFVAEPGVPFCPIYRIKGTDDPFGCRLPKDWYRLPQSFDTIIDQNGFVTSDVRLFSFESLRST